MFSIQQVADKTGLSAHTLRYYEKCGLIDTIERDGNGYRIYTDDNMARIQLLCCLRRTGMSIKDMQSFAELLRTGNQNIPQRLNILESHREQVEEQICELQSMLKVIDSKIQFYSSKTQTKG